MRGVSRTYGDRVALAPLDLDIPAGRCVALLGPNGSGKSTLLRLAAGRDAPTAGTVQLDGLPLREDDPKIRARVAVAGDGTACYPDLTVREHLELVALAHGLREEAGPLVTETLTWLRLAGHADAFPDTLSSGQRQALLLGAALVRPRDLLILDEPEQRLDPDARARLADWLRDEKAADTAVLLATHQPTLARLVADQVLVLDEGLVAAKGRPDAVLDRLEG